jgi:hypothetical protein
LKAAARTNKHETAKVNSWALESSIGRDESEAMNLGAHNDQQDHGDAAKVFKSLVDQIGKEPGAMAAAPECNVAVP